MTATERLYPMVVSIGIRWNDKSSSVNITNLKNGQYKMIPLMVEKTTIRGILHVYNLKADFQKSTAFMNR